MEQSYPHGFGGSARESGDPPQYPHLELQKPKVPSFAVPESSTSVGHQSLEEKNYFFIIAYVLPCGISASLVSAGLELSSVVNEGDDAL